MKRRRLLAAQRSGDGCQIGVLKDLKNEACEPRCYNVRRSSAPPAHRSFVSRLLRVAVLIERLYMRQRGTLGLDARIPTGDALSRALFHRNQGPFCMAPKTESDPNCHALADKPKEHALLQMKVGGLRALSQVGG